MKKITSVVLVLVMVSLCVYSFADENQLINPSEAYIIECLEKVDLVVMYGAVTEDNDPNKKLNEPDGYTSCVYFATSLLGWRAEDYSPKSLITAGTSAGGCIEVYRTVNDAVKRKEYLDGWGSLAGYSAVKGSVVIRTSEKLSEADQKRLEQAVIAALTGDDQPGASQGDPGTLAEDAVRKQLFEKYNGFVSISAMSAFMDITNTVSIGYLANNSSVPSGAGVAEAANKAGSYTFSYYVDPNTQELHVNRITFNALTESNEDSYIAAMSFLAELSALGVIPDSSSPDFVAALGKVLQAADARQSVTINGVTIYFVTGLLDGKTFVFASAEGFDL